MVRDSLVAYVLAGWMILTAAGCTETVLPSSSRESVTEDGRQPPNESANQIPAAAPAELNAEQLTLVREIAKKLGLTETDQTVLVKMFRYEPIALEPMHRTITHIHSQTLADHIAKEWMLRLEVERLVQAERDIQSALQADIDGLSEELAARNLEIDTLRVSASNLLKQLRYLLGLTTEDGSPLQALVITDIGANANLRKPCWC